MADVLSWNRDANLEDVIQRSSQALLDGRLVLFPADSTYVIAGLAANAASLAKLIGFQQDAPRESLPILALSDAAHLASWLPDFSPVGERLARRCWPGALTLLPTAQEQVALRNRFPEEIRPALGELTLGIRSPGHVALLYVLHVLQSPLILIDTGQAELASAQEIAGDGASLACDAGPCPAEMTPTVIQADGDNWVIIREGSLSKEQLTELAGHLIVFVCTGNTCRSPLAEALCRKLLADKLECDVGLVSKHGYLIRSAGISARPGLPASPEAERIAQLHGGDLTGHVSTPLDPILARQADSIVCMTQAHLQTVLAYFPEVQDRARLLSPDGIDLPDPIGQDEAVYRQCAEQILRDLEALVVELLNR